MRILTVFSFLPILMVTFFALTANTVVAQKLSFSDAALTDNYYDIIYVTGQQDDNVVVWCYQRSENRLQVDVFNHAMHLLSKASYKLDKTERLVNVQFLKPGKSCDALIQYYSKDKIVTQVFILNMADNSIIPSTILQKSEPMAGIIVKNPKTGSYIGMIRAYTTRADSILIQYSVYNGAYQLIKNIPLLLPQKPAFIELDNSIIDDSGNLFFYTIQNTVDVAQQQDITLYELNITKDSLLINHVVRDGMFSKVVLQRIESGNEISVSGIWKTDGYTPTYVSNALLNDYFFLAKFDNNLIQRGDTKYYSVSPIVDSVLSSNYLFSSSNIIPKDNSTSLLYISGLANYTNKPTGNYFTPGSKPDIPKIGSFFQDRLNSATSGINPVAPNIPNVYGSASYGTNTYQAQAYNMPPPDNGNTYSNTPVPTALSGENFFLALTINENGIAAIQTFKDEKEITSTPQFEYVTSTKNNMHYLYSRTEKKGKQLIFDLVVDKNGNMHKIPIVNNPKRWLSLTDGKKVSANCIVFPYYHNQSLLLARMDIE